VSGVDYATLRWLAGLKAKKAQAALAARKREEARAAAALANTDNAAAATYEAPTGDDGWMAQWRLRAALEELRLIQKHALEEKEAVSNTAAAAARHETARELGAAALEADHTAARRREETRRADRLTDTLASLRKPMR
jgi:hypothetical protein